MRFACVWSRPAVSTMTTARPRRLDRVVGDGGGVRPAHRAHKVRFGAVGPDLELFLGRRSERVRRGHDDGAVVLAELLRQLADRRRLAGAVHADDQ
jgi:hypothetical protein